MRTIRRGGDPIKTVVITSPATDAGKTMIAAGLADAATVRGIKTIFLDMDTPVGDALRVFGIKEPGPPYPTLSSWNVYQNVWEHCLKSHRGTYLLPKPEIPQDIMSRSAMKNLLSELRKNFEVVIADLGSDFSQPARVFLAEEADLRLLVVDCDDKAVTRVKEFFKKAVTTKKWILVINSREAKNRYTPKQIFRLLKDEESISEIMTIPYIKNITDELPYTFCPRHKFARDILENVYDRKITEASVGDKNRVSEYKEKAIVLNTFTNKYRKSKSKHETEETLPLHILSNQCDILKTPKKSTLIDLSGITTMRLYDNHPEIWKSDWRLGLRAEPIKLPSGSLFYGQSQELGECDERDEGFLMDFILHLSYNKNPLYIIDPGKYTEMINRIGIV